MSIKALKSKITQIQKPKKENGGEIPHGREEVEKAILDAAEKLLLVKSPNKITVREIAKAAKIKHPLIHRYFGTKEKVIVAVHARGISKLESLIADIENIEENVEAFFLLTEKSKFRQIALARAMMDGVNPHLIQNQFPVMQHILRLLRKRRENSKSESKYDAETITAILGATALGWFLYEPFLLASTGLDKSNKDEVRKDVIEFLEEVIKKIC
jgi:AcrR family transcriptional regulator